MLSTRNNIVFLVRALEMLKEQLMEPQESVCSSVSSQTSEISYSPEKRALLKHAGDVSRNLRTRSNKLKMVSYFDKENINTTNVYRYGQQQQQQQRPHGIKHAHSVINLSSVKEETSPVSSRGNSTRNSINRQSLKRSSLRMSLSRHSSDLAKSRVSTDSEFNETTSFGSLDDAEVVSAIRFEQLRVVDGSKLKLQIEQCPEPQVLTKIVSSDEEDNFTIPPNDIYSQNNSSGFVQNNTSIHVFESRDDISKTNTENQQESKNRKRLTKSGSFMSLRSTLSMKSLASITGNKQDNVMHEDAKETKDQRQKERRFKAFSFLSKSSSKSSISTLTNENSRLPRSPSVLTVSSRNGFRNRNKTQSIMISNPIPQAETRDRIKSKFRKSTSIRSISSYVHGNSYTEDIERIIQLCNQKEILSFTKFHNHLQFSTLKVEIVPLKRTANTLIFEEFHHRRSNNSNPVYVWKVWKINQFSIVDHILQEIKLILSMNGLEGHLKIKDMVLLKGPLPKPLQNTQEDDDDRDNFYILVRTHYAGVELKNYEIKNWVENLEIFKSILKNIEIGRENKFQHRNLTWENILIKRSPDLQVTFAGYKLCKGEYHHEVLFRDYFDMEFFNNDDNWGKYYNMMRNLQSDSCGLDFNVSLVWIYYINDILMRSKNLQPIRMGPIVKGIKGPMEQENKAFEHLGLVNRTLTNLLFNRDRNSKWTLKISKIEDILNML